jgi:DNA-binding beta-propeller fold protein YncE
VLTRRSAKLSIRAAARLVCVTAGAVLAVGAPSAVAATAYLTSFSAGYPATAVDLVAGTSSSIANPDGSAQVAIAPDGATAYLTNFGTGKVTPIDVATGIPGPPITVGGYPYGIAIAPDGATAYVTDLIGNIVTPIDLVTHTAGPAIHGVSDDRTIIITPDGSTAYVATGQNDTVTPIDLATGTAGTPIAVTGHPDTLGISTDGKTIYAALGSNAAVTPIDVATQTAGTPIALPGTTPVTFANTPDGATIYVIGSEGSMTPIDTATNTAGPAIALTGGSTVAAVSADGTTVYVAQGSQLVPVRLSDGNIGAPLATLADTAWGIAIAPARAPTAAFAAVAGEPGEATSFDASASTAMADEPITSYRWSYGDGETETTSATTSHHTYSSAGDYTVTLAVNPAGCPGNAVFNGQSLICAAGGAPKITHVVHVEPPSMPVPADPATPQAPAVAATPPATPSPAAPVLKAATLDPGAPTSFAVRAARSVVLPILCPSSVTCGVRGSVSTTAGALLGRPDATRKARHYAFRLIGLSVAAGAKRTAKTKLSASFLRSARRHHVKSIDAVLKLVTRLPDGSVLVSRQTVRLTIPAAS